MGSRRSSSWKQKRASKYPSCPSFPFHPQSKIPRLHPSSCVRPNPPGPRPSGFPRSDNDVSDWRGCKSAKELDGMLEDPIESIGDDHVKGMCCRVTEVNFGISCAFAFALSDGSQQSAICVGSAHDISNSSSSGALPAR